jgi:hypothetical protein
VSKTAGRIDQTTCLGGPVVRFGLTAATRVGMMFVGLVGTTVANSSTGWGAASHFALGVASAVGNHSRPPYHLFCHFQRKKGPLGVNKSIGRLLVAGLFEICRGWQCTRQGYLDISMQSAEGLAGDYQLPCV